MFVLRLFVFATLNILCFLHVIYFFVWKYYLNMSNKLLIGFLDLKNICFDTNIIEIGTFLTILETKMYFMAAILNFQLFGGKKWRDFMVPGSFEFSIVQSPMLQIFMLLSGLHIRPTTSRVPETDKLTPPRMALPMLSFGTDFNRSAILTAGLVAE